MVSKNKGKDVVLSRQPCYSFGRRTKDPFGEPARGQRKRVAQPGCNRQSSPLPGPPAAPEGPPVVSYASGIEELRTKFASRSFSIGQRRPAAYLPAAQGPAPTCYSPRRPGEALQRGTSFGTGHQGTVPASHATGAATDGAARACSPPPSSYSPQTAATLPRAASFTFGSRRTWRDPAAAVPGPGAYDLE